MTFEDLRNFIIKITGYKNKISFTTNSITVGWYADNKDKADYYFWIDPPWRIVYKNEIIINSFNYPYHENYKENENDKEKLDFDKWSSKIVSFQYDKIVNIEFSIIGDLKITLSNGACIDVFVNDIESSSYHFYDYVSWFDYEIYPGKLLATSIKKRNR